MGNQWFRSPTSVRVEFGWSSAAFRTPVAESSRRKTAMQVPMLFFANKMDMPAAATPHECMEVPAGFRVVAIQYGFL